MHGDGVDELPLDGSGVLYDVTPDGVDAARDPRRPTSALPSAPTIALAGGTPEENARLVEAVLGGERGSAPGRRPAERRRGARRGRACGDLRGGHRDGRDRRSTRGAATGLLDRLRDGEACAPTARATSEEAPA